MEPKCSHYSVHKSLPLVPILSQMNPVHIVLSNFSNTHCNSVILSSHLCLSLQSGLFTSCFPTKPLSVLLHHICHVLPSPNCPSYPSSFDHSSNFCTAVVIMQPLITAVVITQPLITAVFSLTFCYNTCTKICKHKPLTSDVGRSVHHHTIQIN